MVNKKALKSRMEEKKITFEDLRKALNVPLWKAKRFIAGLWIWISYKLR